MNKALIAQRLIHLRGKRTQAEVAKAIHISKSALSSYESGARMPRDEVKIALSKLYGKSSVVMSHRGFESHPLRQK